MFLPMSVAPLIGYSISGYCLSLFTDFYKTSASELGITPQDPQWQGAWWLGFLLYGCCSLLLSVPLFFFPGKMEKPKSYCCFTGLPVCCKGLMAKMEANMSMSETQSNPQSSRKPLIIIKSKPSVSRSVILMLRQYHVLFITGRKNCIHLYHVFYCLALRKN